MEKVNLSEKLALFSDQSKPKIVGELNGQEVKLVNLKGLSFATTTTTRRTKYGSTEFSCPRGVEVSLRETFFPN